MNTSDQSSDQQQHDDGRQRGVVDDSPAPTTGANVSTAENGSGVLKRLCLDLYTDFYFPRRYIVVLLLFVGLCVVHAQRVNVGVAVVSIVDSRHRVLPIEINDALNTTVMALGEHSVRLSAFCLYLYVGLSAFYLYTVASPGVRGDTNRGVYFCLGNCLSALSVPCVSCSKLCFIATVLLLMSRRTTKVTD